MQTFFTVHTIAKNTEGKYLILQRAENRTSPGTWNFVTGYVQEKESAEDACLRELKEETNLTGKILVTSDPWWRDKNDTRFIIVTSLVKVDNESEIEIDKTESQSHKWVSLTDSLVKESEIMKESLMMVGIQDKNLK